MDITRTKGFGEALATKADEQNERIQREELTRLREENAQKDAILEYLLEQSDGPIRIPLDKLHQPGSIRIRWGSWPTSKVEDDHLVLYLVG